MKTNATVTFARHAGLRYISSFDEGIRRLPAGRGFYYVKPNGKRVRENKTLKRIRKLAIPPAWREVWVCPSAGGHVQATGRDDRGRKQYVYHPRWRAARDETKYNRMVAFGRVLPAIRKRVRRDLRTRGLGREKVLAAVVRLLDMSAIRIGSEAYAQNNKSYGLTTLLDRHVEVKGVKIHLRFRGKGGKHHDIRVEHPRLSRILKRCQELPGQELFQYVDERRQVNHVTSGDVNDYLLQSSGEDFTSKDFRTWTGTVLAAIALRELDRISPRRKTSRNILRAIERVAERLGNTPTICRKCYIHPVIFDSYLDGSLVKALRRKAEREMRRSLHRLTPEEAAVLAVLQQHLKNNGASLSEQLKKSLRRPAKRKRSKRT